MSNLRKIVATALSCSDQSDRALVETALDRVRALAFADALGGALWRLCYANQADSFQKVVFLLSKRIRRKHEPINLVVRMCEIVVLEYLDHLCKTCGGRGVRADEAGVRHTCPACDGTGVGFLSDQARRRAMKLSDHAYDRWAARFKVAHDKLTEADAAAQYEVAVQLGRIGGRVAEKRALSLLEKGVILASGEPANNQNYRLASFAHSTSSA